MSRELIGGFQSEGPFDFLAPALDYCMYTSRKYRKGDDVRDVMGHDIICDEMVPFWQLVYHGYILSTPSTTSINYTLKDIDEELYMLECGGRPLMYYYSKFGEERNWMGDIDLRCGTEEEMNESIEAIRKASEFAEKYKHLQYETIEKHEKLSDGVYQTTYSDETVVTVDYNTKSYTIKPGIK